MLLNPKGGQESQLDVRSLSSLRAGRESPSRSRRGAKHSTAVVSHLPLEDLRFPEPPSGPSWHGLTQAEARLERGGGSLGPRRGQSWLAGPTRYRAAQLGRETEAASGRSKALRFPAASIVFCLCKDYSWSPVHDPALRALAGLRCAEGVTWPEQAWALHFSM